MFFNCYALQIPQDTEISVFSVELANSIFPESVRTNNYSVLSQLHYRKQLLTSGLTLLYSFPRREPNDSYSMRFIVKGVELIQRRNKRNNPCYENWEDHDTMILKQHVKNLGCAPPYFTQFSNIPICSTKEQMAASPFTLRFDDYRLHPPCQGMEKIYFSHEESEMKGTKWFRPGHFWIGIYLFDQKFKEIVQIKAIDMNGLIGYIGGYIGLILGYSILQIPEYILILIWKYKAYFLPGQKDQDNILPVSVKEKQMVNQLYDK